MESFTIQNLSFFYPKAQKPALAELTFSLPKGDFITLCGPSGCGKSTLLRQLKPVLTPYGQGEGTILFEGQPLAGLDLRTQSSKIGFVSQNPDTQTVTDKVWHELAFGLESLGYETPLIRRKVGEIASFFGIEDWFYQDISKLSGGQKQLLNLASTLVMEPSVLLLDEPTSQLDPIAARDFLGQLHRVNQELGLTILLTEQRLEEALPLSDLVLVLDEGRLLFCGDPLATGRYLQQTKHRMFKSMPTPIQVYSNLDSNLKCPLTVKEGHDWLDEYAKTHPLTPLTITEPPPVSGQPCLELDDIWFRYAKDSPDILKGLSLKIYPGEFFAVLGGNGTGKTTALALLTGRLKAYRGRLKLREEQIGLLPQNVQTLFLKKTAQEDLQDALFASGLIPAEKTGRLFEIVELCRLEKLLDRHPYDLSGGEQQRLALAKVLLNQPRILLLDEPTKGLDAQFKEILAGIIQNLQAQGVAILMVSHDLEFCAKYAQRCALFFDGAILSEDTSRAFFANNSFYTTTASRMARHLLPQAVTPEDIIKACGGELPPPTPLPSPGQFRLKEAPPDPGPAAPPKLSRRRKILILLTGLAICLTLLAALPNLKGLTALASEGGLSLRAFQDQSLLAPYILTVLILGAELGLLIKLLPRAKVPLEPQACPRPLNKRSVLGIVLLLTAIPLTIFAGIYFLEDRRYYIISLLIICEILIPFFLTFEGRKPQARELIIIAVMCAIAVAGRAAFFMLPQFKPVIAIIIIAGVALGAETGFLVGAMTAFVSNMFFGQGPWTPWQMLAFGLIGFLGGLLFQRGRLPKTPLSLCIFGGLATFIIYGGLMNPAALLTFQPDPTWEMLVLTYLQGLPFDLIHAFSTMLFLGLIARPMLEKLDRVKLKYGLLR